MNMMIIEEKENPFFNRKEIKLSIKHPGTPTPSKAEMVKELAAKYSVDETQVCIDYIFSVKGIGESFAKVKILGEKPPAVKTQVEKVPVEAAPVETAPSGK